MKVERSQGRIWFSKTNTLHGAASPILNVQYLCKFGRHDHSSPCQPRLCMEHQHGLQLLPGGGRLHLRRLYGTQNSLDTHRRIQQEIL